MVSTRPVHSGTPEILTRETSPGMGIPRRVVVKGREGIAATVVVTTYRGEVWMSIMPPFTWEAIMEWGKVDELIHVLGLAREEAIQSVGGIREIHASVDDQFGCGRGMRL